MASFKLLSVSWWYSCVPCEKLNRATFIPALSNFSSIGTDLDAGPIVQTIFVFGFLSSFGTSFIPCMSMFAISQKSNKKELKFCTNRWRFEKWELDLTQNLKCLLRSKKAEGRSEFLLFVYVWLGKGDEVESLYFLLSLVSFLVFPLLKEEKVFGLTGVPLPWCDVISLFFLIG